MPTPTTDPSSLDAEDLYVTVCSGHRCRALLSGPAGAGLGALRTAVGQSSRTVLVSTGCLGGCAVGPLMAVSAGRAREGRVEATDTRWLGPMQAERTRALARWVAAGGPAVAPLPAELSGAELRDERAGGAPR